MWHFKWLRRMVRRNTRPIPEDQATVWRQRLSFAYVFFAWNAFGMVCYLIFTGRKDWAKYYGFKKEEDELPPGQQWAKTLGIENAKVIRFSGFQKQGEYKISKPEVDSSES
ncbi:uncharacterized protein [Anabrus simplex]|uniref:uncharacterized protein n=1 Tax=Anabrus simplex TaxID=316456 RepID=UPI0035A3A2B3